MKKKRLTSSAMLVCYAASLVPWAPVAYADETVRCESENNRRHECSIRHQGYVRLDRQLSSKRCVQGRNWNYDRHHIWVDDGCRAEFIVESHHGGDSDSKSNTGKAVAAGAAIALIAAAVVAGSAQHNEQDSDRYEHGGPASHLPGWMIGDFHGYNPRFGGAEIDLSISKDGRAEAIINGKDSLNGYVSNERLHIQNVSFYLERSGNGFNTKQVGDEKNVVHYSRK